MRIKITSYIPENAEIPINYQHYLVSLVYTYLSRSDKKFATKLHEGLHLETPKKFKFYTFSWLQIPKRKVINEKIKILSPEIYWYISSVWDEFLKNLVNGILELGYIKIKTQKFQITKIETLPDEIPQNCSDIKLKFSCLSPIVVSTKKEFQNRLVKTYYKPEDPEEEIVDRIIKNLINKYKTFYNTSKDNFNIKIQFDKKYLQNGKPKVLVHYLKKGQDIEIPAIMCPFTIEGNKDLIKFGYECGFGELNSSGFGMVKVINYEY